MQKILQKYCVEEKDNGLLLIDLPTGSGKTFNIIEFIYDNYDKIEEKIFFITPLKKNLTYDKLKQKFEENNKVNEFQDNVIYIKSNCDGIVDCFSEIYNQIPATIKNDKVTKRMRTLINIIEENKHVDFRNEAIVNLREEVEPQFRSLIESYVLFKDDGTKRNYDERVNFIEEDNKWIEKLYPAVRTDKSKVIFMTVDKFLAMNSTIIKPSYTIISSDIIDDSVIFIDEFDSAKENILNSIIQDSINNNIGLIDLFHSIYAGLTVCDFTEKLMTPSNYLKEKKEQTNKYYFPKEVINGFHKEVEKIKNKYNLQYLHKISGNPREEAYFLFQDHRFISVLPKQKKFLLLDTDADKKINNIIPSSSNINNELQIKDLLIDIKNFINYFKTGIGFIANNYKYLKYEIKDDKNLVSDDACVKTVLSEFNIEGKYLNYLSKNIIRKKKNKESYSNNLVDDLDFSVNGRGFCYYSIIDSDLHDTQSKIEYVSVDDTPEKILFRICEKALVIGISASSSLRTVTGNFDIKYLEEKMDRRFKHLTKEERNNLKLYVSEQQNHYDRTEIVIKSISVNANNLDEQLKVFNENCKKIIEKEFKNIEKNYVKERYLKMFLCMKEFVDKKIQSFLFLSNKLLKDNDKDFDLKFVRKVFNEIIGSKDKKLYKLESLYGDIESYEKKKMELENDLYNGYNVFLTSSYQTLGAGQNIQYRIPEKYVKEKDYVEINDLEYNSCEKDFEAIFIEKPTNVFVNMNNDMIDEEQFIKFIYQVKVLEESGDVDEDFGYTNIKKAFNSFHKTQKNTFKTPDDSINLKLHNAKIIQQAIGRICRTKNKSKKIYILYDDGLKDVLKGVKKYYKNIFINPEYRKLLEEFENKEETLDITMENRASSVISRSKKYISGIMNFKDKGNIVKWEQLRDLVLREPTSNSKEKGADLYIELPAISNYYFYDSDAKKVSFDKNVGVRVDDRYVNIRELLSIPEVKKFFELKGYATKFVPNKYMISPVVIESIYKGALGEVIGEFLFERFLNIKLDRMNDDVYERFDYCSGRVFIDFKNHSGYKSLIRDEEIENIRSKLEECGGGTAIIVNILKPKGLTPTIYDDINKDILIVPFLYDLENNKFNFEAIEKIKNIIENQHVHL